MDGRLLLKELMAREKTNPSRLQATLRAKGLQSALSRYLKGEIDQPRLATIDPVLRHYRIEYGELVEPARTAAAARRMGFTIGSTVGEGAAPVYLAEKRRPAVLPKLLQELARELLSLDGPTRAKVGKHIMTLIDDPENADLIAELVARAVTPAGNSAPQSAPVPESTN